MAKAKSKDCLVGFELSGGCIRIAAIMGPSVAARPGAISQAGSSAPASQQLAFEEIVIPEDGVSSPEALPPASILVPLFKTRLGRLGISGGRAAVAVDGSRMVLRTFLGSAAQVRDELRQAAERSINYVQFGMGDRVVGEHLHTLGGGRTHALLGVSAATTIDPLAKTLEQVGLQVEVIEPALVALTRMVSITGQLDDKAAMLVLVNAEGIDIGVVCDGHLLFSRRPRPAAGLDSESHQGSRVQGAEGSRIGEYVSSLPRELEKISRHYMRAFNSSEEVRRVILCGPADLVGAHAEALKDSLEFEADLLRIDDALSTALAVSVDDLAAVGPPSPGGAGHPSKGAHAVALGAAAGLVGEGSNLVGPNLTSERGVQRRPVLETLFRTLFWPTLAAMGIWGGVYLARGHLDTALTRLQIEVDTPSPVETTYRELQMQITQHEQKLIRLGELVERIRGCSWAGLVESVSKCVPDRLWFTGVRLTGERLLTIQGAAYDEVVIYELSKHIQDVPLFEDASITGTTSSQHGNTLVTEFSLECTVASKPAAPNASPS